MRGQQQSLVVRHFGQTLVQSLVACLPDLVTTKLLPLALYDYALVSTSESEMGARFPCLDVAAHLHSVVIVLQ